MQSPERGHLPFTEIPNNAFQGCTALTTVTIPATVTFIGNYAFDGCSALTQAIHLGENVATIGAYAFRNTRLAGLTIDNVPPATVEVPAQHLESWTSPATGHNSSNENTWEFNAPEGASLSFNWAVSSEANCDWFRVYLDGNLLVERSGQITGVYNEPISAGNHTLLARYSKDGSAVGGTDNGTISDITIGAGLHGLLTVGEYAFNNAPMLAVDIQRENVSIPVNAFEGCNALTEVKLNTASVSSWFAGRSELRTVNLGSAVTTIADQAFQNCNKLGSVFSYNTTPPTIGANTFNGIPADAVLYVTEGSEEAYSADTEDNYWKQFTTIQGIADGIVPCALPQFAYNAYNLTITSATAGAAIYYTTDGSVPTTSSSQYSAALPILFNQTVRAIAVKEGYANSPVAEWSTTSSTEISARYKVAAPTSNITETGENTFSVTFVVSKPDERIADHQLYYTTAEYQESLNKWTSELTVDEIRQVCTLYDGSYILNRPAVVHAIALRDGWIPSDWQAFDYSRGYSPSEPDVTYYSLPNRPPRTSSTAGPPPPSTTLSTRTAASSATPSAPA